MRAFARWTGRSLDALAALAFALAYAARYVRPGAWTWPLQLAGVLLPFVTLALGLLLLLRLRTMSPRTRLAYAVMAGLATVRFVPEDVPGRLAPSPSDLTVVTYNLPRWAGPEAGAKQRALVAYAASARPLVWAFQEPFVAYTARGEGVVVSPFLAVLRDSLGYRVGRTAFARSARSAQPVFTAPDVRVVQAEERRFSPEAGAPPTNYTRVVLRHGGHPAVLYNVHLWTTGRRKPWQEGVSPRDVRAWGPFLRQYRDSHLRRAREADTLAAALARETLPVLVVGDFNATPHEWAFGRLARGLDDAGREGRLGWGATWHRRAPVARIDHVLVSPALRVVEASHPPLDVSDHKALAVRLRWR